MPAAGPRSPPFDPHKDLRPAFTGTGLALQGAADAAGASIYQKNWAGTIGDGIETIGVGVSGRGGGGKVLPERANRPFVREPVPSEHVRTWNDLPPRAGQGSATSGISPTSGGSGPFSEAPSWTAKSNASANQRTEMTSAERSPDFTRSNVREGARGEHAPTSVANGPIRGPETISTLQHHHADRPIPGLNGPARSRLKMFPIGAPRIVVERAHRRRGQPRNEMPMVHPMKIGKLESQRRISLRENLTTQVLLLLQRANRNPTSLQPHLLQTKGIYLFQGKLKS